MPLLIDDWWRAAFGLGIHVSFLLLLLWICLHTNIFLLMNLLSRMRCTKVLLGTFTSPVPRMCEILNRLKQRAAAWLNVKLLLIVAFGKTHLSVLPLTNLYILLCWRANLRFLFCFSLCLFCELNLCSSYLFTIYSSCAHVGVDCTREMVWK